MKNLFLLFALLLINYSAQSEVVKVTTTDGVDLYVKVEGKGTPLLYIHGGPGSGSYWFEKFFGEFMEEHFTVVYLDQRGVGRSGSAKDGNYSMDRMVQDFEEIRQQLGFDSWLTLGHSFGGILQMGYAERFPKAQKGMLMINCTLDITQTCCESWFPKAAEFLEEKYTSCETDSIPVVERMGYFGNKLREKKLFWKMAYEDQANEAVMDSTLYAIPHFNYDFGNAAMNNPEFWNNFKSLTQKMEMPVLFFYGRRDWMIGPEHYKGVNFPQLMLWESEVGHIPFLEAKEDLKNAILAYLEKYDL
ncbi:proline iminopeptidase [Salinimicrobium catena]|uniref:Proline iminopeptidase n=1 Tax=Salinimicrobium catena TaxID=390640 RepID=A0A1H5NW39_9FLAO|nr:alpha/beta hydrolase [Salinimicrobium catena]SDL59052.1 proline iminopeptidase [Salinimicrobium catena]SEF05903.1 proline iminopeptidase [Salinimicrobium catena]